MALHIKNATIYRAQGFVVSMKTKQLILWAKATPMAVVSMKTKQLILWAKATPMAVVSMKTKQLILWAKATPMAVVSMTRHLECSSRKTCKM